MKRAIMMTGLFLLSFLAPAVQAGTTAKASDDANRAKAGMLIQRLHVIRDMDLKSLTPVQRTEMRTEVKEIRSQLQEISGGVYLSIGAIIIIILLLILLL